MAAVPSSQHTTANAIVRWYVAKPQEHRPHMGASLIGHQCQRFVWLTFRWALQPEFSGRILRLFDTGQREESRLVEELRGIGAEVWDKDPESGDQFRVSACGGHFGGSLDGIAKGLPEAPQTAAVLEFKTHNDKSFNELEKSKVKSSKPQHFDQMTIYMGLMDLTRALYMAVNKNTDAVYTEWVEFDKGHFDNLIERAQTLIDRTSSPEPLSHDPSYYICKMCNFHKHCHGGVAAEANCRTCCFSSPKENAVWFCDKHKKDLSDQDQREGCGDHLLMPSLIPYATAIDGGTSWLAYKHKETGTTFVNGTEALREYGPHFSSKELHLCPSILLPDMIELKNQNPGSTVVVGVAASLFDDLASDIDDIPVKSDHPIKKVEKKKIKAVVDAMKKFSDQ